jgi:uncharacterized membrane protein
MPTEKRPVVALDLLFVLIFAGLAACGVVPDNASELEASDSLETATISGIYDKPINLRAGRYEGEPFVPGGASRPTVTLLPQPRARSDVDADGNLEWLVVLAESSGGSGTFLYLAVVKEDGGRFDSVATVLLGDRVEVERVSAEGANVRVDLLRSDKDDFSCCPTGFLTLHWQWNDDQLEPVVRLAGRLIFGHEAREFESCGGRRYWVADATGGDLQRTYEASIGTAYQSRFVEVLATRLPEANGAFAASYDEQLRVTDLLRLETEGPGCSLDLGGAQFRALGVEPFWHLDVDTRALRLSRLGQASLTFAISAIESNATTTVWRAQDESDTLILTVEKARCTDSMSGSLFAYTAEVRLGGEMLSGCALTPLPRDPG